MNSTLTTRTFDDFTKISHFYINAEWVAPVQSQFTTLINPATEEPYGELAMGTSSDVDRAVNSAREAFPKWASLTAGARAGILDKVLKLVLERSDLLAHAITLEMGAAISFSKSSQVPLAAEHIRVARDVLTQYHFLTTKGSTATRKEPIGVCALITPWNWPLYQITSKVAPALAAGCTVVLKPSEYSPLSALLFAQIIDDAGVPPGVFNLIYGSGPEVGSALAAHPDIDMVSITGSNRAGVMVAQTAAPTVKRVAQELGGKSPNIVLPDADLEKAIPLGVLAAFRNVGQSCSAPTRMIVPRQKMHEIESIAGRTAESIVTGDPNSGSTTLGPIANAAQFERVQTMIRSGIDCGAEVICGGLGRAPGFSKGYFTKPTIFSNVNPQSQIAQEEIFGPVLCIIPYDTVDEAIEIANGTIYGLGAHVQTQNIDAGRAVAYKIRAGQVHINHPAFDPYASFGGYKHSGNGREYGVHGFEEFLEIKSIVGHGEMV